MYYSRNLPLCPQSLTCILTNQLLYLNLSCIRLQLAESVKSLSTVVFTFIKASHTCQTVDIRCLNYFQREDKVLKKICHCPFICLVVFTLTVSIYSISASMNCLFLSIILFSDLVPLYFSLLSLRHSLPPPLYILFLCIASSLSHAFSPPRPQYARNPQKPSGS